MATMRRPVSWASTPRRESTAGIAAFPGSDSPSDSTMQAIVEAVPMVMQWPAERLMQLSASRNSCSVILPAFTASLNRQTTVPEPMASPR